MNVPINDYLTFLCEQSNQLNAIQTNVSIMITSKELNILSISDALARQFGVTQTIIGKPIENIKSLAAYSETLNKYEKKILNNEQDKSFLFLYVLEEVNSNEIISYFSYKNRILDPNNNCVGILNVFTKFDLKSSQYLMLDSMNSFYKMHNNISNTQLNQLSQYYKEICYLITLNYSSKQIAHVINLIYPKQKVRTENTINKAKLYICQQLGLKTSKLNTLKEYLIKYEFYKDIPLNMLQCIKGVHWIC